MEGIDCNKANCGEEMTPPCPNCHTNNDVVECAKNTDEGKIVWCCDYCNLVWEVKIDEG